MQCKLRGALVAQLTMWSPLIVLPPIVFHDHPGFRQCPQLFPIQTLIPEPAVEALYKTILPRAAGINVECLDLMLLQPLLHCLGNELGPIVRAQMRRRSLFRNRLR